MSSFSAVMQAMKKSSILVWVLIWWMKRIETSILLVGTTISTVIVVSCNMANPTRSCESGKFCNAGSFDFVNKYNDRNACLTGHNCKSGICHPGAKMEVCMLLGLIVSQGVAAITAGIAGDAAGEIDSLQVPYQG
eukprot:15336700-Ditylum_brightwellii.AAC.2